MMIHDRLDGTYTNVTSQIFALWTRNLGNGLEGQSFGWKEEILKVKVDPDWERDGTANRTTIHYEQVRRCDEHDYDSTKLDGTGQSR